MVADLFLLTFSTSNHKTDCINCPLGYYVTNTGSDAPGDCKDCRKGKYLDGSASRLDGSTPDGVHSDGTTTPHPHDEAEDCLGCPAGTYLVSLE